MRSLEDPKRKEFKKWNASRARVGDIHCVLAWGTC